MPSGAKKRKAAKKKKVNDASTTNPHQEIAGENDGGELRPPTPQDAMVEVVKREDSSSEKISKDGNEEEGNVEIETVTKSKDSNGSSSSSSDSSDDEPHVVEKEVVVVESAPIESVPVIESLPVAPIVDPVKPVDSLLEEVSQVFDVIKNDERKDLVVEETHVVEEEQKVDDCETAVKDDRQDSSVVAESVLKEVEVEKLQPLVETTPSESRDDVSSSTPPKELGSEANGADRANEIEPNEHSDRQAPAASAPVTVQNTTSWKSCCGIFELFSGSAR